METLTNTILQKLYTNKKDALSFSQNQISWLRKHGLNFLADSYEGLSYKNIKIKINELYFGPANCVLCGISHQRLLPGLKGFTKTCSEKCFRQLRSKQQTENNTCYKQTIKTRNLMKYKLSKIMKNKILSGEFTPKSENYFSHTMIKFIHPDGSIKSVRSLWEMLFWLNHPYLEYEKIRLKYFDNKKQKERNYIVDFYDSKTNTLYEIKPKSFQKNLIDKLSSPKLKKYNFYIIDEDYFSTLDKQKIQDTQKLVINLNEIISRYKWLNSSFKKITNIKEIEVPENTYNLNVADNHNYFAEGINVSNCHQFKAISLKGIMEKSYNAEYRFGTTGTLDGTKTYKLVLEGLFGKVYKVTTTDELIKKDILAKIQINCLMLHYPEDICKLMKKAKYQDEVSYLIEHEGRNRFIRNLAISLKGNTLILFQLVGRHGELLYNDIKNKVTGTRKVFFISGKIKADIREEIRKITETQNDAIIVASYGTYSVGVNIRNLHNVIFSHPALSRIRVLQSLGRGMRKGEIKDTLNLFDISDILEYKSHKNHTMKHFIKRMEIYNSEKFDYKMFKIRIKC